MRISGTIIYGLYDSAGVCLYVGITGGMDERYRAHLSADTCQGLSFKMFVLCIAKEKPFHIESRLIEYYQSIGQCQFNKVKRGRGELPPTPKEYPVINEQSLMSLLCAAGVELKSGDLDRRIYNPDIYSIA